MLCLKKVAEVSPKKNHWGDDQSFEEIAGDLNQCHVICAHIDHKISFVSDLDDIPMLHDSVPVKPAKVLLSILHRFEL